MPRTCVILQPSYLPWRGVFDQIRRADVYVHYDDVQYDKNGWRNRNRIKGPNGPFWLTIPVTLPSGSAATRLDAVRIAERSGWARKHWASIESSYRSAPHFEELRGWLAPRYAVDAVRLVDVTIPLLEECARQLGLVETEFVRSSELGADGERSARLVEICRRVGADRYLSGPSARDYLDVSQFDAAGIDVEFVTYRYAPYAQIHGDYDPQVSIVDTLAMLGPDAARALRSSDAV